MVLYTKTNERLGNFIMLLIADLAQTLFFELDSPSDLSVGAIKLWLTGNLGRLNSLINGEYTLDSSYQISPDLGENEAAIFKQIYYVYYWDKKLRSSLGAASVETVVELTADGNRIRRSSKTEISKVYSQAKRDAIDELNRLVTGYKSLAAIPLAVFGDDYIEGNYSNPAKDTRDLS